MLNIYVNHPMSGQAYRQLLFDGAMCLHTNLPETKALCQHAAELVRQAFEPLNPLTAQQDLGVEEFIKIVSPLKSEFTNGLRTKELVKEIIMSLGQDTKLTYFDLPRLRVIPYGNYLTAGVSYAYKPHRDTWYAGSHAQLNYWMPVFKVTPESTMVMYPGYWNKPVQNSSVDFDYGHWQKVERPKAEQLKTTDNRIHPLPLESFDESQATYIAGNTGDLLAFSAAHLHGSAPNTSEFTRFSIDFRIVNINDLMNNIGAHNIDCAAKGSTLTDYISAYNFVPLAMKGVINA